MRALQGILLSSALLCASCSQQSVPQDHYQSTPVTADGKVDDWVLPLRFSNFDYTMSYDITSDARNIYVVVQTRNGMMQHRILAGGLDVYFDPKGGKSKAVDLAFPERQYGASVDGSTAAGKMALLASATTMNTMGFKDLENGQFSVTGKGCPIRVAIAWGSDSSLVYEAIVPIHTVLGHELTKKSYKKSFSVGIAVGDIPGSRPQQNQQRQGRGGYGGPRFGMGMGGMGMGMGMGMRGGGYGRGGQNDQPRPADESHWYTFRFAPPSA